MSKKKQFAPHIYQEWGELFEHLTDKQNADILKAITKYPNFEPENNPVWNFIKSQIEKDYEIFVDKCNKNGEISRSYWQSKKTNDNQMISDDIERIPNDIERYPKRITNNNKRITNNEIPAEGFYGKYNNVFLTAVNYRKLEVMAMSKKKLQSCIDYLSTSIEAGDYKVYDDSMPDKHYEILTTQVKRSFTK